MAESKLAQLQLPASGPLPEQVAAVTNPLLIPTNTADRLRHFPEEVYDLSDQGHLAKFMKVLLGDMGAGQLRKALMRTRLQQTLAGTHFYALDKFYGALFSFRRSVGEFLSTNPEYQVTNDWQTEHAKDASYRSRIVQFAKAISYGATPTAMELVAEAVFSIDCDVYESYIQAEAAYRTYADLEASYATYAAMEGLSYGVLEGEGLPILAGNDRREFIVRPKRRITQSESYDLIRVLNNLKPADSRVRVDWQGVTVNMPMTLRGLDSDSEYWEVISGPIELPLPAFSKHQGDQWTYDGEVQGVSTFSVTPNPVYIYSALSGNVVEVDGYTQDEGQVGVESPGVGLTKTWVFEQVGADTYRIVSLYNGLVLDAGSNIEGGIVGQRRYTGAPQQLFRLTPDTNSGARPPVFVNPYNYGFVITAVGSGRVLELSTSPQGTKIIQTTWRRDPSQVWYFGQVIAQPPVVSPVERIYFSEGRGYQDYPPRDVILPLQSELAARVVSDGVLVSGPYGGFRPPDAVTLPDILTTLYKEQVASTETVKRLTSSGVAYFFTDYYPLDLVLLWIRDNPIDPINFTANRHFWVSPSRDQTDHTVETIEVRLTEKKLVNHITFETSRYPHVATCEYFDNNLGAWIDVYSRSTTDSYPATHNPLVYAPNLSDGPTVSASAIQFLLGHPEHPHSASRHWVSHDIKFPHVTSDRFRITLQRGPGTPPLRGLIGYKDFRDVPLAYTLAVRKETIGYRIDSYDDLLPFLIVGGAPVNSLDLIGQTVRFTGKEQTAQGLLQNPQLPWRSEPQPFNYAVVNLWLDTRTVAGDPSTIDRLYIDPTYVGCHITIYWSNDGGEPDYTATDKGDAFFASLAWNPIPRDYTAQKGYLHLPPTRAKWFKLEFTNLVAEPIEVFVPIRRKVRIFSPTTVAESEAVNSGLGPEGRPVGTSSAIDLLPDHQYADAVRTLAVESPTRSEDSPTSAFYVRDPHGALTLREQSWVYGFQPYTQGHQAPRFMRYETHTYQEVELFNTGKVGFFCGLSELIVYRVDHTADDDTKIYTDTFQDFLNIEPAFTWGFNPGILGSGSLSAVVAQSKPMNSLHNVKAVQFATSQSEPIQMLSDDEFRDPSLGDYDWMNTDLWNKVGDAQLLYRPNETTIRVVRHSTIPPRIITHSPGLDEPIPYPVFSERVLTLADQTAEANTFGGIASGLVAHSAAGRVHAAVRVLLETTLTQPLVLQILQQDGTVLVEGTATGKAGDRLEWYVGWTITDPPPVNRAIRARLIQRGKTDDVWRVDTLSLFDDGIVWDFSVNGGVDWYPASNVRNNAYGVVSFPAPGNQLVWRVRGTRQNVTVSGIRIRPLYVGVHNARQDGTHRGPNVSVWDHDPPIQDDPWFTQWDQPIPRTWFYNYKGLSLLPVVGAANFNLFSRFYARPVADAIAAPSTLLTKAITRGRSTTEQLSFYFPISDGASRAGSVFRRTTADSASTSSDVALQSVRPAVPGIVAPPVHPE